MMTPVAWLDQVLDTIARARAPKEPPRPLGPMVDGEVRLERAPCPLCGATRGRVEHVATDDWVAGGRKDTEAPKRPEAVPGAAQPTASGYFGEERAPSDADADAMPREFAIVRCEVCTALYTTPRFRREHRAEAYPELYPFYTRAKGAREGKALDAAGREAARRAFEGRARHLTALRPRPGRLLDIGMGDGFFLDVMRERGWSVAGADVSEVVVWHAKEALGLSEVSVLDVEVDPLPAGPFEVVTLWGVLQLAYRPQRLLEKVRSVLAPGGLVAIGVSNASGLGASLFGRHWYGLGVPRHLVHFTPATLERLVTWAGFRPVKLGFESPRWIVSGSIENVLPRRLPTTKLVKAAAYGVGAVVGHTRLGDTMELYAERVG